MPMRYVWITLMLLVYLPVEAGVGSTLRKAGKLYENGKYGQALSSYEQALQQDPQNTQATFGAGAAAYQLKEYQQAKQAFEEVANHSAELGQDALFNLGNTYYRAGQQDQAINAYRQAIIQNPADKEAIHNLQIVLQQQNQQNNNNQNNQNQDKNSQNNDQQDQQNNQGQAPNQDQQQQNQPQQPQNPQNQLDKQAADRVMQLARDNEYKRPTQPGQSGGDENVEKDW